MEKITRVDWTDEGKLALKLVYDFHAMKSESWAEIIVNDIVEATDAIVFSKQYQIDPINPKYRRVVVGDYKVLYNEYNNVVYIMNVVSTKQSPEVLKSK